MMTKIELDENDLKALVISYLHDTYNGISFEEKDVKIFVKSKQNYKAEWENAAFKAELLVNFTIQ